MLKHLRGKKKNRAIAILCAAALLVTSAALLVVPALAAPGDLAEIYTNPFTGYLNLPFNTPLEFIGPGSFQWRSSNPTVVEVVPDPLDPEVAIVTGKAAGFATVVNSTRSGVANMRNFSVVDNSKISAYRIPNGANGGYLAKAGDTLQINAKVWKGSTAPANVNLIVADAAGGDITWTSLDTDTAEVTADGLITAKRIGAVIMQGKFVDPWGVNHTISYFVTIGLSPDKLLADLMRKIREAKDITEEPDYDTKYTPESRQALEDAIAKGEDVVSKFAVPGVSADDMLDAMTDLDNAIGGMTEYSPDELRRDLEKKIQEAEDIVNNDPKYPDYTDESRERLENAIRKGKQVRDKVPPASPDEIKDAISDLDKAIGGLQEESGGPGDLTEFPPGSGKYYKELGSPKNVWVQYDKGTGKRMPDGNIIYVPYGIFPPEGAENDNWYEKDKGHVKQESDGYYYTPDNGANWYKIGEEPVPPINNFTSNPPWGQDLVLFVGQEKTFELNKMPGNSPSKLYLVASYNEGAVAITGAKRNTVLALEEGVATLIVVNELGREIRPGTVVNVTVRGAPVEFPEGSGIYYYELAKPKNVWVQCDENGKRINNGNIIYTPYGVFPPEGSENTHWYEKKSGHVEQRADGYYYTPDNGANWYKIGEEPVPPITSFTSSPNWQNLEMYVGESVTFNFSKFPADSPSRLYIVALNDNRVVGISGANRCTVNALNGGTTTLAVVNELGRQIGYTISVKVTALPPKPPKDIPDEVEGRVLPAQKAGDSSDWLEIAQNGEYSLIIRANCVAPNSSFNNSKDAHYAGSLLQSRINAFYAGLSANSGLKQNAIMSDAVSKIITSHDAASLNNKNAYSKPTGYAPTPGATDVAFAPSYQEFASFCSIKTYSGSASPIAKRNYNYLKKGKGDVDLFESMTRSPYDSAYTLFIETTTVYYSAGNDGYFHADVPQWNDVWTGTYQSAVNGPGWGVRPAMWVRSSIFD